MTISLTQVVGRVLAPSGAIPSHGRMTFLLSGWDTQGVAIIPHGPVDFQLDADGYLDAWLWPTATGSMNRVYRPSVTYWSAVTNRLETEEFPPITVPASASAINIAELLGGAVITPPPPDPPTDPYVILIAGQSNAAGVNNGGLNPASPRVQTWDGVTSAWGGSDYTGLPWSRSTPNGNGGNNNYALARAHRIADDTGRDVRIVFDAVGGTSIDAWVAAGTSSTRYAALKAKVEAALVTLPGKTAVDEIIWAQGEEDFTDDFATHLGNLTLLRNQLRAETWCGYIPPIYFMGPSPLHDRYQWQNAFQYFCAKVDSRCIYVPSNGLRTVYQANGVTDTPGTGDFTHFLGESLWEAGYYRISDAAPVETAPILFYGRGIGPASQADPTVLATFSSLVSFNSWTAANPPNGVSATGSITWGLNCNADGNYSYTFGDNCATDNVANYTILAGRDLSAGPDGDYCAGFGKDNVLSASYCLASGRGHTTADNYGVAVGSFSRYTTAQADSAILQVGIGTSEGARANGLTVRESGTVEIYAPSTAANPAQNEEIVFKRVNNTTLSVLMRGTDGTVRSVNLTLA